MVSETLNFKIKRLLDDIIDHAYRNSENLRKYHSYFISLVNKKLNSVSGRYYTDKKVIEIYNLEYDTKIVLKCCLHEVSHHIDTINRGKSDHGPEFYDVYKVLVHTSLNMGIFSPDDFKQDIYHTDREKVMRMIKEWTPHMIPYSSPIITKVYNAYDIKDFLRTNGFRWNGLEKTWEKENCEGNIIEYLKRVGAEYVTESYDNMEINAYVKIAAIGQTYENRELLKKAGFRFSEKIWCKTILVRDYENEIACLDQIFDNTGVAFKKQKEKQQRKKDL